LQTDGQVKRLSEKPYLFSHIMTGNCRLVAMDLAKIEEE
jgi:hypothetical protein